MTTLVTGGAGFVGLNIAEQLLKLGQDAVTFGPDEPSAHAWQVLSGYAGNLRVSRGDVRDPVRLDEVIAEHGITRIVHGAAVTADLDREKRSARHIFEVNLQGTIEVLEAASRHNVGRVIQLSSGSVFGTAGYGAHALTEQSNALPESLYGISKFAAERVALRYRDTRGLNVTIVRLGMVFGPWEHDTGMRDTFSMALQTFLAARRGDTVVIHSDPGDDWIYSVDVATGIIGLLDRLDLTDSIFHLSGGQQWSLAAWCHRLQAHFSNFQYRFSDQLSECTLGKNRSRRRSTMDISLIRRTIGFEPAYLTDSAFQDYLEWQEAAADPTRLT